MMGKRMMSVVLLLAAFAVSSCEKIDNLVNKTFNSEDLKELSYGADSANVMDVYLPAGRGENTRVLILVHGGNWYAGDKDELTSYATTLRRKGYAVVNMNYRLVNKTGTVHLKEQLDDVKNAVNFVWEKADEWGVSKKVALVGTSAGAHLSMLHTYTNNADNKVQTVVSLAGPTNLTDTRNASTLQMGLVMALIGVAPASNPLAYVNGSPVMKVGANSKPTLIFHGNKDAVVNIQQSMDLKAALDKAGVKNKLVIYEAAGHEVVTSANIDSFFADLDDWFNETLK